MFDYEITMHPINGGYNIKLNINHGEYEWFGWFLTAELATKRAEDALQDYYHNGGNNV